ncbi:MAG TPA: hypothetical protein VGR85_05090 [Candidatus Limnocylindria bacterium]|nr:hypothetical protein [Candidatus Limnocylindria bacterium]
MSARLGLSTGLGLCRFCLREDVALTREHVFARWLVERLRAWRVTHGAHSPANTVADTRIARLVTNVCGVCNAGWMSGLEVSFRQAVFARSRPERLAEPTRRTLSRWFTKTAILVAHAGGQELVPQDRWPELTDAMPGGIRVGLARLRRPRQPLDLAVEYSAGADDRAAQLTSVAIQADDLVAIVTRRSSLAPATTLWPIRSHVLRWTTLPVVNRLSDLTDG